MLTEEQKRDMFESCIHSYFANEHLDAVDSYVEWTEEEFIEFQEEYESRLQETVSKMKEVADLAVREVVAVEAIAWLKKQTHRSPFAAKRFNLEEANEFLIQLYGLGAIELTIPELKENELYTDTLYVRLPTDKDEVIELMVFIVKYRPDEMSCVDKGVLRLWWG